MFTALGAVFLVMSIAGIAAHVVDSERQIVLVAGALAPPLLVFSIPGAVLLSIGVGWPGLIIGFAVLDAAAFTQRRVLPSPSRARSKRAKSGPSAERPFTVLHANILLGRADPDALVALVAEHEPDVFTVVELTPQADARLRAAGLTEYLPHSYVSAASGGNGTGIFSRHPLVDEERHDGFVTELLSARVQLPSGRAPLVFAVHPVPPWPRDPSDWVRELALLRQLLNKIPVDDGPVVVAGDFNATQDHRRYRDLQDCRYVDAAVASGAGMLTTYSAQKWYPPVIAIDHVLVAGMTARSVRTVVLPGSDHRGILAELALADD